MNRRTGPEMMLVFVIGSECGSGLTGLWSLGVHSIVLATR